MKSRLKMILVEFHAPKELVEKFDELIISEGFASRAEALRQYMRRVVARRNED
jgi:metal-responsive CopG/Arc/MetJ family transcriptional regulator